MNKSMKEIQSELRDIELDMKTNYSRWGDLSNYVREETILKLKRIRLALSKPLRIEIKLHRRWKHENKKKEEN